RDEMEEIKRQAREELAQLESERRALQTDWIARQKKRIAELERNFAETQKRLEAEAAHATADIKDRALRAQFEKQTGRRMSKLESDARAETDAAVVEVLSVSQEDLGVSAEAPAKPVALAELTAGLRVRVKGYKQALIFRRQDGRLAEVEAGPLRMKVPLAEIIGIESDPKEEAASRPRRITVTAQPSDEPAAEEINVIGCTVEEASSRVDKFLDEAALAGKSAVRIIHGYGTGALRRGLAGFLKSHPLVEAIRHEAEDRGGEAITIAELRG
ncbi:MAG: Smr/MutS family protein, partial [Candidatus Acidiferrales bacterium]